MLRPCDASGRQVSHLPDSGARGPHASGPLVKAAAGSGTRSGKEERASLCYCQTQVLSFRRNTQGAGARAANERGQGASGGSKRPYSRSFRRYGSRSNAVACRQSTHHCTLPAGTMAEKPRLAAVGERARRGSCAAYWPHRHPCLQKQQKKQRLCFQPLCTPTARSLQGWWRWQRWQGSRRQRGQRPRGKGWRWPRRWRRQHHGS